MTKKFTHVRIDTKTHEILKLESAKRKISMLKLVHDAVIEYLERHETPTVLTPEIIEKIKVCAVKVFEPKTIKTKWTENLIKIIVKKLDMREDTVRKGIEQLIEYGILIKDYKNEISYYPEFEESIKALNGIGD